MSEERASLFPALDRLVLAVLNRPCDPNVCARCSGMGGIYIASNGGRTFVRCPECKGKTRA